MNIRIAKCVNIEYRGSLMFLHSCQPVDHGRQVLPANFQTVRIEPADQDIPKNGYVC